ncbi:MAG: ribonuclease HII [Anaerovoracaceae bacterium]|jgi:ribonuclease HII
MKKEEREKLQREKLERMKQFDREEAPGALRIAGVDEVGRGPLAGPVVAACVVLPENVDILGIDDSKKISEKRRETLSEAILDEALAYGFGRVDNHVIDEINILEATKRAMKEAVRNCEEMLISREGRSIDVVLIDAVKLDKFSFPQRDIIHGDQKSLSIASASIIAKVHRDREMRELDRVYPGYGFASNKGYGTKAHYEGIRERGITEVHRRTFLKGL